MLKFIYSEKATKFCEISTSDLIVLIKSKVEISQNCVAFSEHKNFTLVLPEWLFFWEVKQKANDTILCSLSWRPGNNMVTHLWQIDCFHVTYYHLRLLFDTSIQVNDPKKGTPVPYIKFTLNQLRTLLLGVLVKMVNLKTCLFMTVFWWHHDDVKTAPFTAFFCSVDIWIC